jgi:hypothetical protein
MSVESVIASIGGDVKKVWTDLKADIAKGKAIWNIISSPQTRSVLVTLGEQAITTVEAGVAAGEVGAVNLALDATVVSDIKTIIADAKAGDAVIVADLAALGIKL